MTSNCWYCRKGGLVDLYFAGRTGVCPKCGKGVNVVININIPVTETTMPSSEPNEPLTLAQLKALPDGTKVYCYKLVDGKLVPDEWEVCRTKKGDELKREHGWMRCSDYAIDDERNTANRRCFLKEVDLNGGNSNKPLTTEELKQMDGQKVWLSRFINGVEKFDHNFCGWHTINAKIRELRNDSGFDNFSNICFPNAKRFGFNAYRTDQSHRANEDGEEEIPF